MYITLERPLNDPGMVLSKQVYTFWIRWDAMTGNGETIHLDRYYHERRTTKRHKFKIDEDGPYYNRINQRNNKTKREDIAIPEPTILLLREALVEKVWAMTSKKIG